MAPFGGNPDELRHLAFLERCLDEPDDERLHRPAVSSLRHNPFAGALAQLSVDSVDAVSFSALQTLAQRDPRSAIGGVIKAAAQACLVSVPPTKAIADAKSCALDAALVLGREAPREVPAFLAGLDAELLAQEAQALFDERAEAPVEVSQVFWRDGGQVLVLLADGRYGVVVKLKGRWRVFTGARDDVLASVPDAHFADATAAVFGDAG